MLIEPLDIAGALLVRCDAATDARGAFSTFWDSPSTYGNALAFSPESAHHSTNPKRGTLRGLHFQRPPHEQAKLVACACGEVWDVVLDLRPASPTYLRWQGVRLGAADGRAVFVPRGCAHGFVTLRDETVVTYLIEGKYEPGASAIARWNDTAFGIAWPMSDPILSERDRAAPDFRP